MNLKALGHVALYAAIFILSACSENLLPNVGSNNLAVVPNVEAYCFESNPANNCLASFNNNQAHILLFTKTSGQQSAFSSCSAVQAALEAQTFNLSSTAAVGFADIECEDDGMTTDCYLDNRVSWEEAEFANLLQLPKDDYLVLTVFKNNQDDDDDELTQPEPGDYIQCSELTLEDDTADDDFELNPTTDTLSVNWPFIQIPGISFVCNETANADCTFAQDGEDVAYAFYKNTSCSALQTGIEDALITADKHIVGDTTAVCLDSGPDTCASGTPNAWNYAGGGGSSTTDILAGTYAVVAHMGDTSSFPVQGDVISCKEVQIDQSVSMISLQEADLLSITWPSLASLEQVDMTCTSAGSDNCTVASIDSNSGFQGYVKDKTCAQVLALLEAGDENSIAMHAQGGGTATCMAGSPDSCSMSVSSWASGIEGGSSMLTQVPQGNYAVISFVDQLGEGNPSPGDVLHCKEVTLAVASIGNIALDNDDLVEPDYPIIFSPSLTAICDDSVSGTANCSVAADGRNADYFFFPATDCASLLAGNASNPTHAVTVSASCNGSTPNTCTQTVLANQWEDEDTDPAPFIEKGSYAVAGFINFDGLEDGPEPGDPLWCKEVVLGSATTSISLANADLRSFE
ncbi:MAG TPA: hypothetical protein PKC21_07825 [Oligoflexia bacterium]|nr:hypothetical protein [Oligoflexia bacterium]HMR25246.1 hypothetical protein [Oligoflexia bacterium]